MLTQPTSVAEYNCGNDKELLLSRLLASSHRRAGALRDEALESPMLRVPDVGSLCGLDLKATAADAWSTARFHWPGVLI
jgi:hypothetical protein